MALINKRTTEQRVRYIALYSTRDTQGLCTEQKRYCNKKGGLLYRKLDLVKDYLTFLNIPLQ